MAFKEVTFKVSGRKRMYDVSARGLCDRYVAARHLLEGGKDRCHKIRNGLSELLWLPC